MIDEVGKFFTIGSRLVAGVAERISSERDLSEIISTILADNNVTPARALIYGSVTVVLVGGAALGIYKIWSHYYGSPTSETPNTDNVKSRFMMRMEDLADAYEKGSPHDLKSAYNVVATHKPSPEDVNNKDLWKIFSELAPAKIQQNRELAQQAAEAKKQEDQAAHIEFNQQLLKVALKTEDLQEIQARKTAFESAVRVAKLPVMDSEWEQLLAHADLKILKLTPDLSLQCVLDLVDRIQITWATCLISPELAALNREMTLYALEHLERGDLSYNNFSELRLKAIQLVYRAHELTPPSDLSAVQAENIDDPNLQNAVKSLLGSIEQETKDRDGVLKELKEIINSEKISIVQFDNLLQQIFEYRELGGNVDEQIGYNKDCGWMTIGFITPKKLEKDLCAILEDQKQLEVVINNPPTDISALESCRSAWQRYRKHVEDPDLCSRAATAILNVLVPEYEREGAPSADVEELKNLREDYLIGRGDTEGEDPLKQRINRLID